ncbi:MAG TPA: GNVR domain-containing protein [Clostridiales bacterium]|nr:GNVR domain-containing protein [Clostridiales bacterium]HQP71001.1 GNVR domain-containing protein [Clostridiales bacterium]
MAEEVKENSEYEIDIIVILKIIWQGRRLIALVTAAFILLAVAYIFIATPLYRSKITLYPTGTGDLNSPMSDIARQFGVAGVSEGSGNYNIPDIAKSRSLSKRIMTHEWQIKGYDKKITLLDYFNGLYGDEKPDYIQSEQDEKEWRDDLINKFSEYMSEKRISTSEDEDTGLIKVFVDMEDPVLARDIANYVSLFVTNWVNESQKESVKENLLFINNRVDLLFGELQAAEDELKKFRESNRNILSSPDLQLELQRLMRQVSIKQEVYLTLVKQKELNQIEENKNIKVVRILDDAIIKRKPHKPDKAVILLLSVIIALPFGSLLVIMNYFLDYKKMICGVISSKKKN